MICGILRTSQTFGYLLWDDPAGVQYGLNYPSDMIPQLDALNGQEVCVTGDVIPSSPIPMIDVRTISAKPKPKGDGAMPWFMVIVLPVLLVWEWLKELFCGRPMDKKK
jgi:hypothetical protein